jgi:hypothetical protein
VMMGPAVKLQHGPDGLFFAVKAIAEDFCHDSCLFRNGRRLVNSSLEILGVGGRKHNPFPGRSGPYRCEAQLLGVRMAMRSEPVATG